MTLSTVLLAWLTLSLPVSLLIGAAIRAGSGEGDLPTTPPTKE